MVNEVTLVGRLGNDAELGYTQGGRPFLRWSMATNEQWTDANGNKQDRSEWHYCSMWGNVENLAPFLVKGKLIYVQGSIRSREYENRDGVKMRAVEIAVRNMRMLGDQPAQGGQQRAPQGAPQQQRAPQGGQQNQQRAPQGAPQQQRGPQGGGQQQRPQQQGNAPQRTRQREQPQQRFDDYGDQGDQGGAMEDDIPF